MQASSRALRREFLFDADFPHVVSWINWSTQWRYWQLLTIGRNETALSPYGRLPFGKTPDCPEDTEEVKHRLVYYQLFGGWPDAKCIARFVLGATLLGEPGCDALGAPFAWLLLNPLGSRSSQAELLVKPEPRWMKTGEPVGAPLDADFHAWTANWWQAFVNQWVWQRPRVTSAQLSWLVARSSQSIRRPGGTDFAQHCLNWASVWREVHPACGPLPIGQELDPLSARIPAASDEDHEEGEEGLGDPDWTEVERLVKGPDYGEFFYHWGDEPQEYRPGAYPVLEQAFKVSKFPEIMGEVYARCHRILSQHSTRGLRVYRYYPGLLWRIMWTLVFYVTLKEGLRHYYREEQRKRREGKRVAMSLDEVADTASGAGSLHESMGAPASLDVADDDTQVLDLDELFTSLTKREREVADLLAEGHEQTSIAELLGLTPGRISQLVSQLRPKCRADPTRS